MSTERTTEQRIERWLAGDAPAQAPDRVLTTTFERTTTARQVRARRWRILAMTPWQISLAAATAFALAALGGAALLVRTTDVPSVGAPAALAAACPGSAAGADDTPTPAGMAIVCLDGSIGLDLGLSRDAWAPGLSRDGRYVAFRTGDVSAGECGSCENGPYLALAQVGAEKGSFLVNAIAHDISQVVWSPDGRRVAYQGEQNHGNRDIFMTELGDLGAPVLDGSTESTSRLTSDSAVDEFPAWSPDGSTIYYSNMGAEGPDGSGFSPTQAIWSVPAEGGTPVRVTPDDLAATMPDVAPDGTLAFLAGLGETWTMAPAGEPAPIDVDAGGLIFSPRWSPDGSRLAVLRYHEGERTVADPELGIAPGLALLDVVVIDPASGEVVDVGPRVATDYNPVSWTPDGQGLLVNRYLAD